MKRSLLTLGLSFVPVLALAQSIYLVQPGDTLSSIAARNFKGQAVYGPGGSLKRVLVVNPDIANPDLIFPGQSVKLVAEGPPTEAESRVPAAVPQPEPVPQIVTGPPEQIEQRIDKYRAFNVGLGYTGMVYKETSRPNLAQNALTVKASYAPPSFAPNWDWSGSFYLTALPMTSSISGVSARFLGVNLRVGYSLPEVTAPWKLSFMGGWYYTTMFVSKSTLGFRNLAGPQFFPVLRRSFADGNAAYAYFKFSPVTNGVSLSLLSLSNRELAVGGGWIYPLMNGNALSLSLDAASLDLTVSGVAITSNSLSLGAGYSW